MRVRHSLLLFVLAGLAPVPRAEDSQEPERSSTVGFPVRLQDLILPGSELEVRPITDRKVPVILRIIRVTPHGTAHRYDLEYQGLEPGTFDLKDYLRRKDHSSSADLPSLPVTIRSLLPPGQALPGELKPHASPWLGGYWLLLTALGVLWVIGLLAILFVRRGRRQALAASLAPRTLADHLRPLIEEALAGHAAPDQLAELERSLIVYWIRRLRLDVHKPGEVLATLREHPEAGPLLRRLEVWLHQPGKAEAGIDVAALLAPYRALPPDILALQHAGAHSA